jgi:hypothetical protein
MRAALDTIVSTHVQLDYVTGEALLSNRRPGERTQLVIATVADVRAAESVGNIDELVELVKRICGVD